MLAVLLLLLLVLLLEAFARKFPTDTGDIEREGVDFAWPTVR